MIHFHREVILCADFESRRAENAGVAIATQSGVRKGPQGQSRLDRLGYQHLICCAPRGIWNRTQSPTPRSGGGHGVEERQTLVFANPFIIAKDKGSVLDDRPPC